MMLNDIQSIKYSVLMSLYYKETADNLKYSIDSMLNQTLFPQQIVIVEDGKLTEELYSVVKGYQIRHPELFKIIKLEHNMGLGISLSIGAEACDYDWIVRMDTDDYSMPNRCEQQFAFLLAHPEVTLIGCNIEEFIDNISNVVSHRILPEKHEEIYSFAKRRSPIAHPAVIYRKDELIKIGNYHNVYLVEDYDLFIRFLQNGIIAYNIQQPLVYMRVNDNFYKRRGGWKYLKIMLDFNTKQFFARWFSLNDYIIRSCGFLLTCLTPNVVRVLIYKKLLRK